MLDLGRSLIASAARVPDALAIVDRDVRLSYANWLSQISALVQGLADMGLRHGDRLVTGDAEQPCRREHPLGLPNGRHHDRSGELAGDSRRNHILLPRTAAPAPLPAMDRVWMPCMRQQKICRA